MSHIEIPLDGEDFGRNVETIMRCDGFKSNFARRLSNRYISRSPSKNPTVLKLRPVDPNDAPERIEVSQLSKSVDSESSPVTLTVKPDAAPKSPDTSRIEVTALNMEVDTLRWQLAQTESNRQMHISLLKQVVTFLNRVKEHIEYQKDESPLIENSVLRSQRSFNYADLPRSRSVVHVYKNPEYVLTPAKKMNMRKMSKSINNVSGKECGVLRSPSKLSLAPEKENAQKITEEITRLITLANTVLSTKIPDLACTCNNSNSDSSFIKENGNVKAYDDPKLIEAAKLNLIEEDTTNYFISNTVCDSEEVYNSITNTLTEEKDCNEFTLISPANCGLENGIKTKVIEKENDKNEIESIISVATKTDVNKKNEYNHVSNFVEDESGFSSMSSFQEIGIPIISIIPPSPCKDLVYMEEIPDLLNDTDKWKANGIGIDKQAVKVFWV